MSQQLSETDSDERSRLVPVILAAIAGATENSRPRDVAEASLIALWFFIAKSFEEGGVDRPNDEALRVMSGIIEALKKSGQDVLLSMEHRWQLQ